MPIVFHALPFGLRTHSFHLVGPVRQAAPSSSAPSSTMRAPVLVLAQVVNPTPSFGNQLHVLDLVDLLETGRPAMRRQSRELV